MRAVIALIAVLLFLHFANPVFATRSLTISSDKSSLFGFTAVKAGRNTIDSVKTTRFMVEPGVALNFNFSKNVSLQTNLSTYFDNTFYFGGNPLKFGVALIYSK